MMEFETNILFQRMTLIVSTYIIKHLPVLTILAVYMEFIEPENQILTSALPQSI